MSRHNHRPKNDENREKLDLNHQILFRSSSSDLHVDRHIYERFFLFGAKQRHPSQHKINTFHPIYVSTILK
jgi:hypothetical protein